MSVAAYLLLYFAIVDKTARFAARPGAPASGPAGMRWRVGARGRMPL